MWVKNASEDIHSSYFVVYYWYSDPSLHRTGWLCMNPLTSIFSSIRGTI